jgi:hypothetical protein
MNRNIYTANLSISKKLLLCLLFLCSQHPGSAQHIKRVLFIGNSFIGANDLPGIVRDFAARAGVILEYEAFTPGGATVKYIPHGDRSHANNPVVYDLIRSRPWDYIVIQDNQGFFCLPTIGDYGRYDETEEGHMQIRDSLLRSNPCGKMLLFSGWLDKDPYAWEPSLGLYTAAEANQRVYEQYKYLNDRFVKQIVSPIGIVWNRVMSGLPHVELFAPDNYHPTYEGSYVTAATLFSAIFNMNPEDVPFDGSLLPADARFIRKTAYEVVTDSLDPTGLATYTPELRVSGGMLTVSGTYLRYRWYRNDVLIPGAVTPMITFDPDACYQVQVTDFKGCDQWSMKQCNISVTGITEPATDLRLYPNPVKSVLHIDGHKLHRLCITDLSGRVLFTAENTNEVDMSTWSPGIYLLHATDESGRSGSRKISKE